MTADDKLISSLEDNLRRLKASGFMNEKLKKTIKMIEELIEFLKQQKEN